jgi:membrane associated rhomboid family serine protease
MLIIPAERGIDWRRAPVITTTLIVLCCLVYFSWQWQDNQRLGKAANFYADQGLLELEFPNFISHLHQTGRGQKANKMESLWNTEDRTDISYAILSDKSFTKELETTDIEFWGADVYQHWSSARAQLNLMLDDVSAFKLGLIPAENRAVTYLTYQFMHGNTLHLVGNMVILALTGVAVEAAIGSFYFLLCYLFCGIAAGLSFTLFNWHGYVPLVGASGAISGVMGMYAALYGLRKIRFFYSVIFYFGYFTAPALVVLPVWIAWELFNAIWGDTDGIAYIAHAGGLITGATGMLLGRRYLLQVEEAYLDQTPDEDEEYRRALDDFLKQLAAFNFDAAKRKLSALEATYADKTAVLQQRYLLEKLTPHSETFHHYAHTLLGKNSANTAFIHMLHDVYCDYSERQGEHALCDKLLLKLMLNFCQIDAWSTVQSMIKQAQTRRLQDPMLVKILRLLARGMEQSGEKHQGSQFRDLADSLEQSLHQNGAGPTDIN